MELVTCQKRCALQGKKRVCMKVSPHASNKRSSSSCCIANSVYWTKWRQGWYQVWALYGSKWSRYDMTKQTLHFQNQRRTTRGLTITLLLKQASHRKNLQKVNWWYNQCDSLTRNIFTNRCSPQVQDGQSQYMLVDIFGRGTSDRRIQKPIAAIMEALSTSAQQDLTTLINRRIYKMGTNSHCNRKPGINLLSYIQTYPSQSHY